MGSNFIDLCKHTHTVIFSKRYIWFSFHVNTDTQRCQQLWTRLWMWAGPCSRATRDCIKSSRLVVKNLPANVRDAGSTPGSGRSPGGGHGHPLQYSCLENPVDGGAWRATVRGVAKSQTQLSTGTEQNPGGGNMIVPILQMKKQRHRNNSHPLLNSGNCRFSAQN